MRNIEDLKVDLRNSVKQFTATLQEIKVSVDTSQKETMEQLERFTV